jgi:geranylgeranyl diphosphate synthase, type II
MLDINLLQEIISKEIAELQIGEEPHELYAPITYTLESGGKRIRPLLVLASCNLFSEDVQQAVPIAMAMEVFHNFTLLHDDIMDNSPIRRNRPTVHMKWDTNIAILSGDAMMIKAYSILSKVPEKQLKPIINLFNKTALEVCEGQQYDMNFEIQKNVTESEYLKMIKLKTSVLIAACLKAGATIGGADDTSSDLLYDFGLNMGIAFQLQDDLLDTYAETSEFGKKNGNDIITGKKTFLLINALEKSNPELKTELNGLIGNKSIPDENKIKQVIEIYNKLHIKELTENKIQEYYFSAMKSIEKLTVKEEKKQVLMTFAEQIINRKK